jgi:hypothetical protein
MKKILFRILLGLIASLITLCGFNYSLELASSRSQYAIAGWPLFALCIILYWIALGYILRPLEKIIKP